MVLRGGIGLYFDRPSGNSIYAQVQNPPSFKNVTVNFARPADDQRRDARLSGPPSLSVFQYKSDLPSSTQWNTGLPDDAAVEDVAGRLVRRPALLEHADGRRTSTRSTSGSDVPAAQNQDSTQTPTFLGSNTVANDQMRSFRGFGSINVQQPRGWATFHSLQFSFQRRFSNGVSFGFNDTWSLYDTRAPTRASRLEHRRWQLLRPRRLRREADELLQTNPTAHTMRGNFVWDLPDIQS